MTDKFVNRFPQLWEKILKNWFQDRIPNEFSYLGKLLTICRNCRSYDCQVITSGRSKIALNTLVCTKKGRHEYQNDPYSVLSSFPISPRSGRSFLLIFMIFRFSKIFYGASWVLKSAVWACCSTLLTKWPISSNSLGSNWQCPKISKSSLVIFTYFPIPITLIWKRAFGAWKPYLKWKPFLQNISITT